MSTPPPPHLFLFPSARTILCVLCSVLQEAHPGTYIHIVSRRRSVLQAFGFGVAPPPVPPRRQTDDGVMGWESIALIAMPAPTFRFLSDGR